MNYLMVPMSLLKTNDESISEQFDSLIKKKMTLEKAIEGVRDDRRKLHAKHLKNFF